MIMSVMGLYESEHKMYEPAPTNIAQLVLVG